MPILGKICLRGAVARIKQRADTLDYFESNFGSILRAQPFQNHSALGRDRQEAQLSNRKIGTVCVWQLAFDPVLLFGGNDAGTPDILPNIAAECSFQIRNDAATNSVAERSKIFVGGVFPKFEPALTHIPIDFVTPD